MWKELDGTRTYYLYAEEGLIAEADETGSLIRQYGWRPDGLWGTDPLYLKTGGQSYYYHNDHLGTPQKLVSVTGQVVWEARYAAFGAAQAAGTIENPLRFAGQYYDAETGMHYNYYRYYDPGTGRYLTSDPIGLNGGLNTYLYVAGNPLSLFDPLGLFEYCNYKEGWCREVTPGGGPICGTGNNAKYIPDGIYKKACENHDRCYSTCGKTKLDCDEQMVMDGAPVYAMVLMFSRQAKEAYKKAQRDAGCDNDKKDNGKIANGKNDNGIKDNGKNCN